MIYDLAIIGGGPAGAAAGVYASRKRLKTVFITKDWNGQSFDSTQIENWIGTITITGMDLAKQLENHVKSYAAGIIDFKEGQWCSTIAKNADGTFTITTDVESYQAKTVLLTVGSRRRKIEVPGAAQYENKGITYCASCDGPLFADQDVAVIGGGNAAFETVAQLVAYCKSVTLLNRSNEFKADPIIIERLLKNPKFKALTNAVPKSISGDKFVSSITYTDAISKQDVVVPVTGIFVDIGSVPNTDCVKDIVKLDQYNRIPVDPKNQKTLVDGLWAAGDCTNGLYQQNNIAVGDAVKALEDIYYHLHAK